MLLRQVRDKAERSNVAHLSLHLEILRKASYAFAHPT
jgi:hypothetical protein